MTYTGSLGCLVELLSESQLERKPGRSSVHAGRGTAHRPEGSCAVRAMVQAGSIAVVALRARQCARHQQSLVCGGLTRNWRRGHGPFRRPTAGPVRVVPGVRDDFVEFGVRCPDAAGGHYVCSFRTQYLGSSWLSVHPAVEALRGGFQSGHVVGGASFAADEVVVLAVCERNVDPARSASHRETHGARDPRDLE